MNKILLTLTMAALFFGTVFGGTLTVTSPTAASNWQKGTAHNITWTHSGCASANVKINIFKNSISVANFVEQLTATLSSEAKNWTIPASYTAGNYVIRVKTEDNACVGDSPVFVISDAAVTPASITVTNPPSPNPTWQHAKTYSIIWQKSGNMDSNVKIQLYNDAGTSPVRMIHVSKPNSGSQNWTVPVDIPVGNYRIKVTTLDNAVSDLSDPFAIARNPNNSVYLTLGHSHGTITGIATNSRKLQKAPGLLTPTNTPKVLTVRINDAFYSQGMSTNYGNGSNPLKIAVTAICTSPMAYQCSIYMSNPLKDDEFYTMHASNWQDSGSFNIVILANALSQIMSNPLPMWFEGEIKLILKNKTTGQETSKSFFVKFTW